MEMATVKFCLNPFEIRSAFAPPSFKKYS